MDQLQNITPQQPQPLLPQPAQTQPQLSLLWTSPIPLSLWDRFGFTVRASRIRSWIAEARTNGIMREGAVKRFGQRYYATPYLLYGWMNTHGETTPLKRPRRQGKRGGPTKATAGSPPVAAGGRQEQPTGPVPGSDRGTVSTAQPEVQAKRARRQLTESQVRQSRNQLVRAAPEGQEAVIARLAKRYGFSAQTIRDAALGRTYQHLPMPQGQPKQAGGRKTKATQAVETAAQQPT
jgi:hypothetical protein